MKQKCIAYLFMAVSLSGCATIFSGSKQRIEFSSNPVAAVVFVDGASVGKTPCSVKLKRNKSHLVVIKLDGYKAYEAKLTKKFNFFALGNIMIGGAVGFIVDASTGAMFRLSPKQMDAAMAGGLVFHKNGDLNIAVTLDVDPSWEKVAQLEVSQQF